ncbi:hypothetical protein Acr_00g0011570 [Actinidia rufa]|uniref:Uncharacterized protein n=1 Tax=Actinidia rufa TaxID=165716 RepID=A0A7J0DA43_9ERIC|nr:hypothetical protein Acr_00g0011570 [Actinidia rufa]
MTVSGEFKLSKLDLKIGAALPLLCLELLGGTHRRLLPLVFFQTSMPPMSLAHPLVVHRMPKLERGQARASGSWDSCHRGRHKLTNFFLLFFFLAFFAALNSGEGKVRIKPNSRTFRAEVITLQSLALDMQGRQPNPTELLGLMRDHVSIDRLVHKKVGYLPRNLPVIDGFNGIFAIFRSTRLNRLLKTQQQEQVSVSA